MRNLLRADLRPRATASERPRARPGADPAQHALPCGWPRVESEAAARRKMHDFGDLGRALEMVALLPGVALGG